MKKNFTDFFARTGRAIAAAVIALAPVALSCSPDELTGDLEDRVNDLENRVTELESQMAEQIEALQGLAGGTTVVSCTLDEETGIYTVAFSDGKVIEVANAGEGSSIIGVTEQDGKYYWTIGGELMTDAGEPVPVSVTPGIRVNPESNIWEVSPDGETWLSTGITATEGASIFAKVEDDEDFVYFTLADGSSLKVAKEKDFICEPLSGKQYFNAGETKNIDLNMSDVKKSVVLVKPDGWKASVEGAELVITAPAQTDGTAETEGVITVMAISGSNEITLADLLVEVGTAPHVITIDAAQNVTITVDPDLIDGYYNWTNNWAGYYYAGACKLDEFSPETIVEQINANTRPVTYREALITTLADLLGSEPEETSYVVWCIDRLFEDVDSGIEMALNPDDMIFETLVNVEVNFEVSDLTFEDAHIEVSVKGADSYYATVISKAEYNIQTVLENLAFGDAYEVLSGNYSGLLSEYGMVSDWMGDMPNEINPGTTYVALAVPILTGVSEYTEEDVYVQEIEIPAIAFGGSMTATVGEVTADYTSVEAEISASDGTYKVFANYISEENLGQYADDDALLAFLTSTSGIESADLPYTYSKTGLTSGDKGYIMAVAVDRAGKAGAIARQAANTDELVFSDVALTLEVAETGIMDATISVSGEGIVSYRYFNLTPAQSSMYPYGGPSGVDLESIENMLAINEYYAIKKAEAADVAAGLELTDLTPNTTYHLYIVGVDASGNPTRMAEKDYYVGIASDKFVAKDSEKWTAMASEAPKISNIRINDMEVTQMTALPDDYGLSVKYTVEAGTQCARYWVAVYNDSMDGDAFKSTVTANIISNYRTRELSATGEIDHTTVEGSSTTYPYNRGYSYIYLIWQDTEGYIYEYQLIDLTTLLNTASAQ